MKNPHAKALGKLGKGKSKTLTLAERRRRADRLAAARLKRWEPKTAHEMLDGKPIHVSDKNYGQPFQTPGGFWHELSHCKICRTPMSRPVMTKKIIKP